MACTSSCRTQDHASWGECVRSKNLRIAEVDTSQQKKADRSLDKYAEARKAGIQPESTKPAHVERAVRISEKTGKAYQAV